ncbi:MAG: redoxin family protein [Eubacteriales bacterium]
MKRTTSRILAALLSVTLALPVLVSCQENTVENPSSSTSAQTEMTAVTTEANLEPGDPVPYSFTVKTTGGLALSGIELILTDSEGNQVADATTDKSGKCSVTLPAYEYTVSLKGLKAGYSLPAGSVKTTREGGQVKVPVETGVITQKEPNTHRSYSEGDIMYDYTFTVDGEEVKLSELLETKKLVVINFWATWCGPCVSEFPAIEEAYADYKDSVAIIALSISDNEFACSNFKKRGKYSFTMMPEDGIGIYSRFDKGGIPLSIYVDRYGMYVGYDLGADTSVDSWKAKFKRYTADNYVQRIE